MSALPTLFLRPNTKISNRSMQPAGRWLLKVRLRLARYIPN